MSNKICKCCGGNGRKGSHCENFKIENQRLFLEWEQMSARVNRQRLEILDLTQDVVNDKLKADIHYENYCKIFKEMEALKRKFMEVQK